MSYDFSKMQRDFRRLTGKRTTAQITNDDVKDALNNFYRILFPRLVSPPEFKGWYTFNTVLGDGEYDLPSTIIAVSGPVYLDDEPISFTVDKEKFFSSYPMDETDQDEPTSVLLFDRTLYVRKIPDGVYSIKMRKVSSTPDILSADADEPVNELWGRTIVYGAAIENLSDDQDTDGVGALSPLFSQYIGLINSDIVSQIPIGTRSVPSF